MFKRIPLTGIKGRGKFATVDDADFDRVSRYYWAMDRKGYVRTSIRKKHMSLHRLVMNAQPGQIVDHIDGDKLNNSRSNLRFVTHRQNKQNTPAHKDSLTGVKGVCPLPNGRYHAQICINGKQISIGRFVTIRAAAEAYNIAAAEAFGEYAVLNDLSLLPVEIEPPRPAPRPKRPPTSSYRGVCWKPQHRKWHAQISHNGKKIGLRYHDTEVEAARAYDAYVKENNIDRPLNFPALIRDPA